MKMRITNQSQELSLKEASIGNTKDADMPPNLHKKIAKT